MSKSLIQSIFYKIMAEDKASKSFLAVGGSMRKTASDVKKAEKANREFAASAGVVGKEMALLKKGLAALGIGAGIAGFINLADTAITMDNQLRLVTESQSELNSVFKQLSDISKETRTPLDANVESYRRLGIATKDLNIDAKTLLGVQKSVNQALIISGSGAQEARAGLIQFAQGLASNRLQGDELRSVLENVPRLAQAIAKGMGTNIGQIRKLASEGKLTTAEVIKAIQSQAAELEKEFAKVSPTIGQSIIQVRNAVLELVRSFNAVIPVAGILAGSIGLVASNLGLIAATGAIVVIKRLTDAYKLLNAELVANVILVNSSGVAMTASQSVASRGIFGKLVAGFSDYKKAIGGAITAQAVFKSVLEGLSRAGTKFIQVFLVGFRVALVALASPIGAVVAAVTAAVLLFKSILGIGKETSEGFLTLGDVLAYKLAPAIKAMNDAWKGTKERLAEATKGMREFITEAAKGAKEGIFNFVVSADTQEAIRQAQEAKRKIQENKDTVDLTGNLSGPGSTEFLRRMNEEVAKLEARGLKGILKDTETWRLLMKNVNEELDKADEANTDLIQSTQKQVADLILENQARAAVLSGKYESIEVAKAQIQYDTLSGKLTKQGLADLRAQLEVRGSLDAKTKARDEAKKTQEEIDKIREKVAAYNLVISGQAQSLAQAEGMVEKGQRLNAQQLLYNGLKREEVSLREQADAIIKTRDEVGDLQKKNTALQAVLRGQYESVDIAELELSITRDMDPVQATLIRQKIEETKAINQASDALKQQEALANGVADAFGDAFKNMITGAKSFRESLADLASQLADVLIQLTIIEPLKQSLSASSKSGTGIIGSVLSAFLEQGGISTQPVKTSFMPLSAFKNAPQFAKGTPNTSGFPAILHPNEAVVPLSGGRSIPVQMQGGGQGGPVVFNSEVHVTIQGGSGGQQDPEQARRLGNEIALSVRSEFYNLLDKESRSGGRFSGSNRNGALV